ncbi:SPOR domain-containing protein [uncultured Abyssibacter sp.]|uniref:SPOR domain-containing protein n=1 Tax=uncultured Abyssibacter sp. TaxID=2320202 RepID=UPI0032B233FE
MRLRYPTVADGRRILVLACCGLLSLVARPALAGGFDLVEVEGDVQRVRGGESRAAQALEDIRSGDMIRTGPDGRAVVEVGRYGRMELAGGSALVLRRIPDSSFALDLATELELQRGFLRVNWARPGFGAAWPFSLELGAQQVTVHPGEFLLQRSDERVSACVRAGKLELTLADGGAAARHLMQPPWCGQSGATTAFLSVDGIDADRILAFRDAGSIRFSEPKPEPTEVASSRVEPVAARPSPPPAARQQPDAKPVSKPVSKPSPPKPLPKPAAPKPESAPVVAPAPVPAATVTTPRRGPWTISLASFIDEQDAIRTRERYGETEFPVEIVEATVKGRLWYRLVVPGFDSVAAAKAAADRMRDDLGVNDPWVYRDKR